jgi:CDP-diacylglycerol--glycerol-3-phosphate 3-phosphatidyltransferase
MTTARIWTVSNILSASRILLLLPLAHFLLDDQPERRWWIAAIIVVATATDFLDGYLARRRHEVTELGKVIDPLADKIAVGGAAVLMTWTGDLPLWYVIVVIARDILIVTGGLYIKWKKNIVAQSNWPGKVAVSLIALVLLLSALNIKSLASVREAVLWLSVVAMVVSLVSYLQRLFIGYPGGNKVKL